MKNGKWKMNTQKEYQKRKRKYKKMQDQRGTKYKTREERDENKDKDDCKIFMIKENRKKQKYALEKKQKSGCSIKTNS